MMVTKTSTPTTILSLSHSFSYPRLFEELQLMEERLLCDGIEAGNVERLLCDGIEAGKAEQRQGYPQLLCSLDISAKSN